MTLRRTGTRVAAAATAALAFALASSALAAPDAAPGPSLAGKLLVASPEMPDPRFARTVVYVLRHDAGGALGVVVNRPFQEVPVAALLAQLGLEHAGAAGAVRVHWGGPVDPGRVLVLHTDEHRGSGTRPIGDGIATTPAPELLRALGTGEGPRRAIVFLSSSGWAPGQLEREVKAGGWVAVPADAALVFEPDDGAKWERALGRRVVEL